MRMRDMIAFAGEPLLGRSGHEAGRALLARLYRQHFGSEMPDILIADRGKPYFLKGDVHFSISHTKGHVFCALAKRPVGIDAEELDRTVRPGLAEKILSPGEHAQYQAAPDKDRALLTFWVLKEATAKCSGQGLRGYPDHTDLSLADPRVFEQDGCLVAVILEDDHAF